MRLIDLPDAPGFEPTLGALFATLQDSTREWRTNLGRVGQPAIRWQAYENGPSIGGLILHMIDCEVWWLKAVAAGCKLDAEAPENVYNAALDQYKPFWPKPPSRPLAWYYGIQDRRREEMRALIEAHRDPASRHPLGKSREFTFRWILAHLVEHDSYTGGQAVLLHEMFKAMRREKR